MTQFYTDPTRQNETYALPDAEVFWADAGEWAYDQNGERRDVEEGNEEQEVNSEGFYWWICLPGCLPDSDPHGPFETEEEAIEGAREYCEGSP